MQLNKQEMQTELRRVGKGRASRRGRRKGSRGRHLTRIRIERENVNSIRFPGWDKVDLILEKKVDAVDKCDRYIPDFARCHQYYSTKSWYKIG